MNARRSRTRHRMEQAAPKPAPPVPSRRVQARMAAGNIAPFRIDTARLRRDRAAHVWQDTHAGPIHAVNWRLIISALDHNRRPPKPIWNRSPDGKLLNPSEDPDRITQQEFYELYRLSD